MHEGLHGRPHGGGGAAAVAGAANAAAGVSGGGPGRVRAGDPPDVRGVEGQVQEDLQIRRRGGVPVRGVQGGPPAASPGPTPPG